MQAARKPNSVLSDHSSRLAITDELQQPTRRFRHKFSSPGRDGPSRIRRLKSSGKLPAYLVLLRVGFTKPPALLSTRWALTPPFHPYLKPRTWVPLGESPNNLRRFAFCCTGRNLALTPDSRTLSGTLPCGVRTFLPHPTPCGPDGSDRPAACTLESSSHRL